MRPALFGLTTLLAVFALLACDREPKTPLERGAGIFARSCSGCHGINGRGTERPGFKVPPRDLTDPELHTRLSDADIARTIRTGKGQMPAFGGFLEDEQIEHLVLYVRSLKRDRSEQVTP